MGRWWIIAVALVLSPMRLQAARYLDETGAAGDFVLADRAGAATLLVDAGDWPGVMRAAKDLQGDVHRVTSRDAALVTTGEHLSGPVVIIGTVGKSKVVDALVAAGKMDVSGLRGKWESFIIQTVENPLPGVASGLVIAGSDKRGTIFGIYDLSETIGVSPWYFWADVPAQHHESLLIKPGMYRQGEPSVKYRGIFINDEAPDLTNWVREKYGTAENLPNVANYGHEFYGHVFELLLRLKANYLWPAMWNNAFNEDDPENAKLADTYGIVMGTSHQEPMLRAQKEWDRRHRQSWNYFTDAPTLQDFWKEGIVRNKDYESILTIGLRGANDTPMIPGGTREQSMELLKEIIAAQRKLIGENLNPNPAKVPQLWCPYKEVLDYYNAGFRVPDDVTILWTDDNWGNLRRVPTADERGRPGGAGVYYHFDYVGGPRNYKWVNTNPLPKVWEEMSLAKAYGADRIWIVNVGHLKGLELPIDYFMHLGWDSGSLTNGNIEAFTRQWAAEQFGPEHAGEIAEVLSAYGLYNGRRKPELLEPRTYSLVMGEAQGVVAEWRALEKKAEGIYAALPTDRRDAFYEMVLFPVKACANLNELYVAAGLNGLYAQQGRASANDLAVKVAELFQRDADLMADYNHKLAGGKWDHFMDQVHIGYTTWQDPPRSVMPPTQTVTPLAEPSLGVAMEGSTDVGPGKGEATLLPVDCFNKQQRTLELFNRGSGNVAFTASASMPWVRLSKSAGSFAKEERVVVDVDWDQAPRGTATAEIRVGDGTVEQTFRLAAFNPSDVRPDTLEGFVETWGRVSVEVEHFTGRSAVDGVRWEKIEGYGRTLSGMTPLPMTAASVVPPAQGPTLEYRIYFFDSGDYTLTSVLSPSLNAVPGRGLRLAVSLDAEPPQLVTAVPATFNAQNGNRDWETTVKDNARRVRAAVKVGASGYHTLKLRMVDPGVVLEKLYLTTGASAPTSQETYLGPTETYQRPAPGGGAAERR